MKTLSQRSGASTLLLVTILALAVGCRSSEDISGLKTELLDQPETYELEFRGNDAYSHGTLQRGAAADLADFEETGFSAAAVDDAAYTIETFYLDRGFPFAEVEYEFVPAGAQKPQVTFLIEEGPRCQLGDVEFSGNERFSNRNLAAHISGPTTRLFGLGNLYYVEALADSARGAVQDLYYENGFLDARVEGPEVEFDGERTRANLAYRVHEGPHFRLLGVQLEGDLPAELRPILERRLAGYVGRNYFPRLAFELGATATDELANRGYPDATAERTPEIDATSGEVHVRLQVVSGELVHVSEITVEGNDKTLTSVIRSRVPFADGDLYRRSGERAAFKELYAMGLFRSVEIELRGAGPRRSLHVRVSEADTLSVKAELGYGAFEGVRAIVGATEENLFGTGRSLSFEAKLAERAEGARVFYSDPWTINEDNVLGGSLFFEGRQQISFDSEEYGAGISITRHHGNRFRNAYGYEYRSSEARNISVQIPGAPPNEGDNAYISEVYGTSVYDSRDSIFLPTGGTYVRGRVEYAPEELASELAFWRFEGRIARYHPLSSRSLLAWTARAGIVLPHGSTKSIPLQERYFNGGQNSVRSFREDELGPTDTNGTPVGGETFALASVELRRALFGSFTGALFVDAGNVDLDHGDFLDFSDMRYGVGPGIRWLLPVGPLRLDWGINPDPHEHEAKWALQFSLGVAF